MQSSYFALHEGANAACQRISKSLSNWQLCSPTCTDVPRVHKESARMMQLRTTDARSHNYKRITGSWMTADHRVVCSGVHWTLTHCHWMATGSMHAQQLHQPPPTCTGKVLHHKIPFATCITSSARRADPYICCTLEQQLPQHVLRPPDLRALQPMPCSALHTNCCSSHAVELLTQQ
jgi:hypothetical protein